MTRRKSRAVTKANKAVSTELYDALAPFIHQSGPVIRILHAHELKEKVRQEAWNMFEDNMYDFYFKSSFGWNPVAKQEEWFHASSRSILVYDNAEEQNLLAFSIFRFECDEGENVIYCYEIQVSKDAQGNGLGRQLMKYLERIGASWGMEKLMLTVFNSNTGALSFYKYYGFEEVEVVLDDEDKIVDYKILSIDIGVETD